MCVCICRDLYVCRYMCSHVCVWSPEDNLRYCSSCFWSLELANRLAGSLPSEPRNAPVSASPGLVLWMYHHGWLCLMWVLVIKHRLSWLHSKHFTTELLRPPGLPPYGASVPRHRHHPQFFPFLSFFSKISFWKQGLSQAWISPSGVGCLVSEPCRCICLSPRC